MQLVISCAVLGVGVAFLLDAALGSDGYSTLISGLTKTSGLPFVVSREGERAVEERIEPRRLRTP